MAEKWNMWDELARHCGVDPHRRSPSRNRLKRRAYRLILGLENGISVEDTFILRFLRENHLAVMANMVRTNQTLNATVRRPHHGY